jgi:uncharacterized zinc-type alcohol dehydrogenase-like protein
MPTTRAYEAASATEPLTPTTIERRATGEHDVRIDIAYAGICHSDIHTVRNEWGPAGFPVTPGHEIAGVVSEIGSAVTRYAVGDRVGVGVFVNSCGECVSCQDGLEQYCENGVVWTYGATDRDGTVTKGGYSSVVVVDENYVCRIPEGLGLDEAAPLLCAGITTYSPLAKWGAGPGKRVAIVGMGGLGHMGVKIAHAMGAHTTVLSHSLRKADDATAFGADAMHVTTDPDTFSTLARSFDLIINTVSATLDVDAFLGLLKVDGTLVQVGLPPEPMTVRAGSLAGARRSLSGSNIGGIGETQEMLDFCAQHRIGASIETISADQINAAFDRVVDSDVRYRFVIDATTF